ncbi:MAG: germination protein YpeB [Oscillospiraceae bacterium]
MEFKISQRGLVRIVSFIIAIILVLSVMAFGFSSQAQTNQRTLEYHYMKGIDDLTAHIQNIDSDLTKAMYAKTPSMLSMLSSKLWREAGLAKESLSVLPIEYLDLQNTNKYLSQVGDYCVSLAKGFTNGQRITKEQRENLKKLNDYCDTMLSEVIAVSDGIQTGSISLEKVKGNLNQEFNREPQATEVSEGFLEFEEGFTAYPTLIYDGPFSDHILQKDPERLKNEKNISRAEAKEKAAKVSQLDVATISDSNDEDSKMASYGFSADGVDISITKKGGLLSYMLKSRAVAEQKISVDDALTKAREYMDSLNIGALQPTYYEISNNVLTINYAYTQDNVLIYTDLIKVSVAMDNGEVTGFDSRGYITNNHYRDLVSPQITENYAKLSVSELLTIEKSQLCIIPSGGLNEVLCYEFKCKSEDNSDVLVYINANTGTEEQILILIISENGQLTI